MIDPTQRLEQQTITCQHCGASETIRSDSPTIQHWPVWPVGNLTTPTDPDDVALPCPECGIGVLVVSAPVPIVDPPR